MPNLGINKHRGSAEEWCPVPQLRIAGSLGTIAIFGGTGLYTVDSIITVPINLKGGK